MMHRSAFRLSCGLLAAFVVMGCDDDGPSGIEEPGLVVTPAFRGVPETDTLRLVATFNGDPVTATWESTNPAVATVSNTGLVSALVPGFTAITATGPNQQKRSASITVVAVTALTSGTGVTISSNAARGSQQFRKIAVPAGATKLTVTIGGGTGDVDLYVSAGGVPTTSNFGCRSWEAGNDEICEFTNPAAGTYFIMLDLWNPYAGATLTATVTP
jgi:hypothetical protein